MIGEDHLFIEINQHRRHRPRMVIGISAMGLPFGIVGGRVKLKARGKRQQTAISRTSTLFLRSDKARRYPLDPICSNPPANLDGLLSNHRSKWVLGGRSSHHDDPLVRQGHRSKTCRHPAEIQRRPFNDRQALGQSFRNTRPDYTSTSKKLTPRSNRRTVGVSNATGKKSVGEWSCLGFVHKYAPISREARASHVHRERADGGDKPSAHRVDCSSPPTDNRLLRCPIGRRSAPQQAQDDRSKSGRLLGSR